MNKYKTVKEVCALTGLTRKHLYYFHHEGVVRAVAYANYSVEGNDGYKLYDDAAVEKLQQISLYYQLGLKRDDIKAIMLTPDYDSGRILHTLLTLEREKKLHIERNIAALEYLVLAGTNNAVSGAMRGISLDDLGRTLLDIRSASAKNSPPPFETLESAETFATEFAALIEELAQVNEAELTSTVGDGVVSKIFELSNVYLGENSPLFILGLVLGVLHDDSVAHSPAKQLTPAHGRALIQHMIDHPQAFSHGPHPSIDEDENNIERKTK